MAWVAWSADSIPGNMIPAAPTSRAILAQDRGLELLKARDSLAEPGSHPDVKADEPTRSAGPAGDPAEIPAVLRRLLDVVVIHGVGGVVGLARRGSCVTTRPRAGPARLWSYTRRDQRER
jgi:hypothetical protein